jgi:hypothetical protein
MRNNTLHVLQRPDGSSGLRAGCIELCRQGVDCSHEGAVPVLQLPVSLLLVRVYICQFVMSFFQEISLLLLEHYVRVSHFD